MAHHPSAITSSPGEIVLDMFLGSGPALIAAEQLGCRAFGMELSPAYVDVCVLRWQALSGKEARLSGEGRTFREVAEARNADNGLISQSDGRGEEAA